MTYRKRQPPSLDNRLPFPFLAVQNPRRLRSRLILALSFSPLLVGTFGVLELEKLTIENDKSSVRRSRKGSSLWCPSEYHVDVRDRV